VEKQQHFIHLPVGLVPAAFKKKMGEVKRVEELIESERMEGVSETERIKVKI